MVEQVDSCKLCDAWLPLADEGDGSRGAQARCHVAEASLGYEGRWLCEAADVAASSADARVALWSSNALRLTFPRNWPAAFKESAALKKMLSASMLRGKRCRAVQPPEVPELTAAAVGCLPLHSFSNAQVLAREYGWGLVKGFIVYEWLDADKAGESFVAMRHWWNTLPNGTWVDLTPMVPMSAAADRRRLLVESPLGEKEPVALTPARRTFAVALARRIAAGISVSQGISSPASAQDDSADASSPFGTEAALCGTAVMPPSAAVKKAAPVASATASGMEATAPTKERPEPQQVHAQEQRQASTTGPTATQAQALAHSAFRPVLCTPPLIERAEARSVQQPQPPPQPPQPPRRCAGIDYAKWDALDVSSDESGDEAGGGHTVQAAAEQAHHQRMRQQQEAAARAEWQRQQESVSAAVDAAIAATSLGDVETLGKIQATARATAPLSEEMEAIIASLPQAAQLAARAAAASVSTSADGSSGTTNSIGAVGTPEVGVDLDGNGGAAPSLRELLAAQSVALNADDPPLEGPEEFRVDAVMPKSSMPAPAGPGAKVVASETKAGLWPPAKADPRETTGTGYIQRGAASGRLRSAIPPHSAAHTESTRVEWLGDWS